MAQCNLLTLQLWSVHTDLSEKKIPDSYLLLQYENEILTHLDNCLLICLKKGKFTENEVI